jgi:hypothetical protein
LEVKMTLCIGLDLGQAQDYTALSIVEAHPAGHTVGLPLAFDVVHLNRYPLGTKYPDIVEDVSNKISQLKEAWILAIDHTGCGRPVFDLFEREGLSPIGITITGGNEVHSEGRQFRVPKRDLVGILQVALQAGRFKVAKELPEAAILVDELLNFRVKINLKTAHDSYEAWREGVHDDLVLSVAMACFTATRYFSYREIQAHEAEIQRQLDDEFVGILRDIDL